MRFRVNLPIPHMFDDASVLCTKVEKNSWIFSPIQTPKDAQHPVSGNRQFGLRKINSEWEFYIRGADRLTGWMDQTFGESKAFEGADKLWSSFQIRLVDFIKKNKGEAIIDTSKYSSRRFPW